MYWTVRVRLQRRELHRLGQKKSSYIFFMGMFVFTIADQFVIWLQYVQYGSIVKFSTAVF